MASATPVRPLHTRRLPRTAVLLLGGAHPHAPDLDRWVAGDGPAYHSPALLQVLRNR